MNYPITKNEETESCQFIVCLRFVPCLFKVWQLTGWQTIDGERYYFKSSGIMATGWKISSTGTAYYLGTDGKMVTGWQTIDGKVYYFNANGKMNTKSSLVLDGKTYKFNSDGVCLNY